MPKALPVLRVNWAAHNRQPGHDKIYIVSVVRRSDCRYVVIGKWCARGQVPRQQDKGIFSTYSLAADKAMSLFRTKINEGYEDVHDGRYDGPALKDITPYLETGSLPEVTPPAITPKEDTEVEMYVQCVDNMGMEDSFDNGVAYLAEKHPNDPSNFYVVYDKNGSRKDCLKIRFRG